jgi:hypothetical protein
MSQNQRILKHIEQHGSINPLMALERYGCMRLAARISELKARGHKIETRIIKSHKNKVYAEYYL